MRVETHLPANPVRQPGTAHCQYRRILYAPQERREKTQGRCNPENRCKTQEGSGKSGSQAKSTRTENRRSKEKGSGKVHGKTQGCTRTESRTRKEKSNGQEKVRSSQKKSSSQT